MATRIYVSNIEASFFDNHTLECASGIPIKGYHKIGDIVISSTQRQDIIGWVCVVEGEPGEWKTIRNAGDWINVEIDAINEEISKIKITNNNTDSSIVLLEQQITNVDNKFINVNTSINNLQNEFTALRENIENNVEEIVNLQEAIEIHDGDIITLKANIVENNKKVQELIDLLNVTDDFLAKDIVELDKRIKSNEEQIVVLVKQVGDNKDNIDILLEGHAEHDTAIENLNKGVTEGLTLAKGLQSNVTSNTNAISKLNTDVSELRELHNDVDGTIDDIVKIDNKLTDVIEEFDTFKEDNPFFNGGKILKGDKIPTEGSYQEGDIVISTLQSDNIIGWICVESGNPGIWDIMIREANTNCRKNDPEYVAEFLDVARSYYKARYNGHGEPTFIYNTGNTIFDYDYEINEEEEKFGNSIDCSTFVGLILRGLSIKNSPYAHLVDSTQEGEEEEEDNGNDEGYHDEYDEFGENGTWDPTSINADVNCPWAVNLMEWSLPKVSGGEPKPIRTASQIAQWMCERGLNIPVDPTFSNLEPGDIIFWAKTESGAYKNPNRFKQISHVAICQGKYPRTEGDTISDVYPWKHTMLEVTSKAPYVLNRTLEKCRPEDVVMICRPDLGSIRAGSYAGNINLKEGVTNVSDIIKPGTYYLTSSITDGLPEGIDTGIYQTLKVERTITRLGKVYSLVQTMVNAKEPEGLYMRTQYCYSHAPNNTDWTDWVKIGGDVDQNVINNLKNSINEDIQEMKTELNDNINSLASNINAKISDMEATDTKLSGDMASLSNSINTKITSLVDVDKNLSNSINNLSSSINNKISNLEAADGNLSNNITNLSDSINNKISGIETKLEKIPNNLEDRFDEIDQTITGIENNMNDVLKFWVGTQAEYDALQTKENGRLYIITD
jgi:predicted  nucleic acid-binding Zn-ribbon protein